MVGDEYTCSAGAASRSSVNDSKLYVRSDSLGTGAARKSRPIQGPARVELTFSPPAFVNFFGQSDPAIPRDASRTSKYLALAVRGVPCDLYDGESRELSAPREVSSDVLFSLLIVYLGWQRGRDFVHPS